MMIVLRVVRRLVLSVFGIELVDGGGVVEYEHADAVAQVDDGV